MKVSIYTSTLLLGLSLVTLLALRVITSISPDSGTFEGNVSQAWAGTVGFGALYTLVLSAAVLLSLGVLRLIKNRNVSH